MSKNKASEGEINFLGLTTSVVSKNGEEITLGVKTQNGEYEIFCPLGLPTDF